MEIHFKIIGFLLIALALIHVIFPKYFDWKNEFQKINLINRQMMYVHTFFIALIVLMMGVFCLISTEALVTTSLGKQFSLGLGIFWFLRLLVQFFVYSRDLWKGKAFETSVHIIFSLLWVYFSTVFLWNYFS